MANGNQRRYEGLLKYPKGVMGGFLTGFANAGNRYNQGYMQGGQIIRQDEQDAMQKMQLQMQMGQQIPGMSLDPNLGRAAGIDFGDQPVPIKTTEQKQIDLEEGRISRTEKRGQKELKQMKEVQAYIKENPSANLIAAAQERGMTVEKLLNYVQVDKWATQRNLDENARQELDAMTVNGEIDIMKNPGKMLNFALRNLGATGFKDYVSLAQVALAENRAAMQNASSRENSYRTFTKDMITAGFSMDTVTALEKQIVTGERMSVGEEEKMMFEAKTAGMSDSDKTSLQKNAEFWVEAAANKGVKLDLMDAIELIVLGSKQQSDEAGWTAIYKSVLDPSRGVEHEDSVAIANTWLETKKSLFPKAGEVVKNPGGTLDPKNKRSSDPWEDVK